MAEKLTKQELKLLTFFQTEEITSALLYLKIAKRTKDTKNKKILLRIAKKEAAHAYIWKNYTKRLPYPNFLKLFFYLIISFLCGYTFIIKLIKTNEYKNIYELNKIKEKYPEVEYIISQEEAHEKELIDLLEEDRLHYIGAIVLGLNDALIELSGTLAGLTFVLMDTKLIALVGGITGIAATLSMASSNYLAEKASMNPKALIASIYTGGAYLITVIFLILPYLLFPQNLFVLALISMIGIVIALIFIFSFYTAIIQSESIKKRFFEMASISLSVSLISFFIGLIAKYFFK